jgi:hypothetical protein
MSYTIYIFKKFFNHHLTSSRVLQVNQEHTTLLWGNSKKRSINQSELPIATSRLACKCKLETDTFNTNLFKRKRVSLLVSGRIY